MYRWVKCATLLFFFTSALNLSAEVLYVNPNGSDVTGVGTQQKPYKTIGFALGQGSSKSNVHLMLSPGTHTLSKAVKISSNFTVSGAGTGLTKIVGTFPINDSLPLLSIDSATNVTIEQCTFDGNKKSSFRALDITRSHNIRVIHCDVREFHNRGIVVHSVDTCELGWINMKNNSSFEYVNYPGVSNNYAWQDMGNLDMTNITNSEVHDLVILEEGVQDSSGGKGIRLNGGKNLKMYNMSITVPSRGLWQDKKAPAIAIEHFAWRGTTNPVENVEIFGSSFNNNLSFVFVNWVSPNVTSVHLHHCRIKPLGYAIESAGDNMIIDHNFIDGGNYPITHWGTKVTANLTLEYNIFHNIANGQFRGGRFTNFKMHNNLVNVGFASKVLFTNSTEGTQSIKNNIFYNDKTSYPPRIATTGVGVENNLFFSVDTIPDGVHNLSVDPRFTKSGNLPSPYYTLLPSSPCINAGVEIPGVTDGYFGKAPDIGPFEFGLPVWKCGYRQDSTTVATLLPLDYSSGKGSDFRTPVSVHSAGVFNLLGRKVLFGDTRLKSDGRRMNLEKR